MHSHFRLFYSFLFVLLLFCCIRNFELYDFFTEWDEQEAIMLCWNRSHEDLLFSIIEKISKHDKVEIYYNENYHDLSHIRSGIFLTGAIPKNIVFIPFRLEKENIWIRDYGPGFVDDGSKLVVADFKYPHEEMGDYKNFNRILAEKFKMPFHNSGICSTGGGRQINGLGTMILIEGYEKEINPHVSKKDIEQIYRTKFNQDNFIWLKRGIPQDDFPNYGPIIKNIFGSGANWHLDEFCRFVDAGTILLTEVSERDLQRDSFYYLIRERLDENLSILSHSVDQDGKTFKILRLPVAPVVFAAGKQSGEPVYYTPVTSYMNFVITNHLIIMPQYYSEGDPVWVFEKDQEALRVLKNIFPTRQVIGMPVLDLNYKGGGLHCITLEKPKLGKKKERRG